MCFDLSDHEQPCIGLRVRFRIQLKSLLFYVFHTLVWQDVMQFFPNFVHWLLSFWFLALAALWEIVYMWHSETFANSKIIYRVKYMCISAGNLWNIVWLHLIASLGSGCNRLSNRPHVNYEARSYEVEASPCETKPEAAKIGIQTSFKKRSGLKTSDAWCRFSSDFYLSYHFFLSYLINNNLARVDFTCFCI